MIETNLEKFIEEDWNFSSTDEDNVNDGDVMISMTIWLWRRQTNDNDYFKDDYYFNDVDYDDDDDDDDNDKYEMVTIKMAMMHVAMGAYPAGSRQKPGTSWLLIACSTTELYPRPIRGGNCFEKK